MHRGGTSAVAGVVHELGAFLGPAGHLMARREDNPAGFYEHQLLTDLNDELLHALGGTWHEPPRLDRGWERAPHLDGIRVRAQQVLHEDFADAPLWVWKDPRTSLTLPFWRSLLPATRFVVCLRNPLEVARSLHARDGLDEATGIDLWMRHTVAALDGHSTMPLLVLYDDLVNDPASEVARIAGFLELDTSSSAVTRARAHLEDNAGLRHHRTTFGEMCAAPGASFAAVALYAVLQRVVALQRGAALRFEDLHDVAGPLAGQAARAHVTERNAAGLSLQLAALDARAAELAGTLDARDADVARAREDVTVLTGRLHEARSDGARLDALLIAREAESAARLSAHSAESAARLSAHNAESAARLLAQEADAADRLRVRNAEIDALLLARDAAAAVLLSAHNAEVAALHAARDAAVTALRAAHDTDVTTLRAVHAADVTTLRAAHAAEVAAMGTAHESEVTALRAVHDANLAAWQAQTAADAETKADLHGDVQRARAERHAAGIEVGRLNALLLHLQTPTGIAKLSLRAVLPPGVHRRLRSWAARARGG